MAPHSPLQEALLRNALKRHAHDSGKYVLINVDDGNSFVGDTAVLASANEHYWYGPFANYRHHADPIGRSMVGVVIQPPFDINMGELGDGRFNITSSSRDVRARLLSNFANYPFVIEKQHCASVEGFIQAIKYPHGSVERWRTFLQSGKTAKEASLPSPQSHIWWRGKQVAYGSEQHHALIERAIVQKCMQNEICMRALLNTDDLTLLHDTGARESPHTSLPASTFCDILTKLRTKLQQHSKPLT